MPKKTKTIKDIFVSVVLLTDSNTKGLAKKVKEISDLLKTNYANYELIVIDNRIAANEFSDIKKQLNTIPCIRVIQLSQSATKDVCAFVGLESAVGDAVVTLTMFDPVARMTDFIDKVSEYDLAAGLSKQNTRQGLINKYGAKIFYWYNKKFLDISIPANATYYMALSRRAVNTLSRNKRRSKHIRYLARITGYSSTELIYSPIRSYKPEKKSAFSLVISAIELTTSYSNHPLRILSFGGFIASILNLLYVIYIIVIHAVKANIAPGWTTLSLQSAIMFFFIFATLTILCEYIGQILQQAQEDPSYHIVDEHNSKISIADTTRRNVRS